MSGKFSPANSLFAKPGEQARDFSSLLGHEDGDELLIAKLTHKSISKPAVKGVSSLALLTRSEAHGVASQVSAGRSCGDDQCEFWLHYYAAAVNLLPGQRILTPETTAFLRSSFPPSLFNHTERHKVPPHDWKRLTVVDADETPKG